MNFAGTSLTDTFNSRSDNVLENELLSAASHNNFTSQSSESVKPIFNGHDGYGWPLFGLLAKCDLRANATPNEKKGL